MFIGNIAIAPGSTLRLLRMLFGDAGRHSKSLQLVSKKETNWTAARDHNVILEGDIIRTRFLLLLVEKSDQFVVLSAGEVIVSFVQI